MSNVTDLLEQRSGSREPAVIEGSSARSVCWAEVAVQAERWRASTLQGPVGLCLADPLAMATNFVAAVAAGVPVAPLDPAAPAPELTGKIEQLGLRALVTAPGAGAAGIETWTATHSALDAAGGRRRQGRSLPAAAGQVSALMASSGTTGPPKVIPLGEHQLLGTATAVAEHLQLSPADRGYSPLPLFHINGLVIGVLSALVAGSSIVVERQFSRRSFWDTAAANDVTWLNLVPAILAILAAPGPGGPQARGAGPIRLARSASAPLPRAVLERFEAATGIPVVETYGMTEAASQITANPLGAARPGSVGLPAGVEVRVVGPGGATVPCGATGEVQIRGRQVAAAYWVPDSASPAWTSLRSTDAGGWLATGDLGHFDEAGYLYLVGRQGDVINRGGEKIQPREVEEVLLCDPRVAAAVVVGRGHPTFGEEPVAYVLPAPGAGLEADVLVEDLAERCRASLSRYKRPAQIFAARSLPAGATGKIRRAAVATMAEPVAAGAALPIPR